jgi:O-antigen/teichoic acid export membrane protein
VLDQLQLDQALVALFVSRRSLGLYVTAVSLNNLPRFIGQSVGYVAYSQAARGATDGERRRTLWRHFRFALIVSAVIVALLEVTAGAIVPLFFGGAFRGAVPIVRIILVSALFLSLSRVLMEGARGLGYPALGTVGELTTLVALAPAIAVLGATGSVTGIALAFAIASAASLIVLLVGINLLPPGSPSLQPDAVIADAPGAL